MGVLRRLKNTAFGEYKITVAGYKQKIPLAKCGFFLGGLLSCHIGGGAQHLWSDCRAYPKNLKFNGPNYGSQLFFRTVQNCNPLPSNWMVQKVVHWTIAHLDSPKLRLIGDSLDHPSNGGPKWRLTGDPLDRRPKWTVQINILQLVHWTIVGRTK